MSDFKRGFKMALGGIFALGTAWLIGVILLAILITGCFIGLRSCAVSEDMEFIQDCAIDRLELDHQKKVASVTCKDGSNFTLADVVTPHGPVLKIYKSKGKLLGLDPSYGR